MDLRLRSSKRRKVAEVEEVQEQAPPMLLPATATPLALSVCVVVEKLDEDGVTVATSSRPSLRSSPRTSPRTPLARRGGRGRGRGRRGCGRGARAAPSTPAPQGAQGPQPQGGPQQVTTPASIVITSTGTPTSPAVADTAVDAASLPTQDTAVALPVEVAGGPVDAPSVTAETAALPLVPHETGEMTSSSATGDAVNSSSMDAEGSHSPAATEAAVDQVSMEAPDDGGALSTLTAEFTGNPMCMEAPDADGAHSTLAMEAAVNPTSVDAPDAEGMHVEQVTEATVNPTSVDAPDVEGMHVEQATEAAVNPTSVDAPDAEGMHVEQVTEATVNPTSVDAPDVEGMHVAQESEAAVNSTCMKAPDAGGAPSTEAPDADDAHSTLAMEAAVNPTSVDAPDAEGMHSESTEVATDETLATAARPQIPQSAVDTAVVVVDITAPPKLSPAARLHYAADYRIDFQKLVRSASSIRALNLADLEFTGKPFTVFPSWRSDDKLSETLASLQVGPSDVRRLDLGDAQWAAGQPFDGELTKLLRKYRSTLVSLRVSVRALVERCHYQHSDSRRKTWHRHLSPVDVLAEVAGLPRLARLQLVFNAVRRQRRVYRSELVPGAGRFPRLREIEVHLTEEWAREHLPQRAWWYSGGAGLGPGSESEDGGGLSDDVPLEMPEDDDVLLDVLRHRQDAVTSLDMVAVRRLPPTLAYQLAGLSNLRTLALRIELLPFILSDGMEQLESLTLQLHPGTSAHSEERLPALLRALSKSRRLPALRRLELRASTARFAAGPGAPVDGRQAVAIMLTIVAERCTSLQVLAVCGKGWRSEDVTTLLISDLPLRELLLERCGALTRAHLPHVADLPALKIVRLPARLRARMETEPMSADALHTLVRRGVDIRWL